LFVTLDFVFAVGVLFAFSSAFVLIAGGVVSPISFTVFNSLGSVFFACSFLGI